MTLTLTLAALCSKNVFVVKEHLIMFIAIKYNGNITKKLWTNYIKYELLTRFEPISCLCDLDLDLKKII